MSGAVKECSDQGTCNTTTYRCNCNLGYRGTNCSLSTCDALAKLLQHPKQAAHASPVVSLSPSPQASA
jgi:hypothetical protein